MRWINHSENVLFKKKSGLIVSAFKHLLKIFTNIFTCIFFFLHIFIIFIYGLFFNDDEHVFESSVQHTHLPYLAYFYKNQGKTVRGYKKKNEQDPWYSE